MQPSCMKLGASATVASMVASYPSSEVINYMTEKRLVRVAEAKNLFCSIGSVLHFVFIGGRTLPQRAGIQSAEIGSLST